MNRWFHCLKINRERQQDVGNMTVEHLEYGEMRIRVTYWHDTPKTKTYCCFTEIYSHESFFTLSNALEEICFQNSKQIHFERGIETC